MQWNLGTPRVTSLTSFLLREHRNPQPYLPLSHLMRLMHVVNLLMFTILAVVGGSLSAGDQRRADLDGDRHRLCPGEGLLSCDNIEHTAFLTSKWDVSQVKVRKVDVSAWEESDKFAFILDNVLSADECKKFIELSESKGYEQVTINIGGKQVLITEARNNDRCVLDNADIVDEIYQRILRATAEAYPDVHHSLVNVPWINDVTLQKERKQYKAAGLNEKMRFLRYDPGTYFAPHCDGSYTRSGEPGVGEKSFVTMQLYLNEDFEGGATRFVSADAEEDSCEVSIDGSVAHCDADTADSVRVVPLTGSVLLFQHDCLHEGAPVRAGRKYAMRTDVMYSAHNLVLTLESKSPSLVSWFVNSLRYLTNWTASLS